MLFITSRIPKEGSTAVFTKKRAISFDPQTIDVSSRLYFCERSSDGSYQEIGSKALFSKLKNLDPNADKPFQETQILLYIHGFNNQPEKDIFPNAKKLEARLNSKERGKICHVVPVIWPCDDDSIVQFMDDYWDDSKASTATGIVMSRLLEMFDKWRKEEQQLETPCYKRINILAHSMGNNVLQHAIKTYADMRGQQVERLFRNIFMVAADVENHTLQSGQVGQAIPEMCRNLVVYYACDDFAMPASKIANIKQRTLSRRLGMTGPEDLHKTPRNVIEVDCDSFNNSLDNPKGHSYFIGTDEVISPCIEHMAKAIQTGRVEHTERRIALPRPKSLDS